MKSTSIHRHFLHAFESIAFIRRVHCAAVFIKSSAVAPEDNPLRLARLSTAGR